MKGSKARISFRGPDRRLRTRFRAKISFVLKSNGQEVRGTTSNISLLGISAFADAPIGAVKPVDCYLNLPRLPQPIVAHGTVIRCEPMAQPTSEGNYQVGVFFKEFEKTGESTLARFLEQIQDEERRAIESGYRDLKKRLSDRRRRKQQETLRRKRRRALRLHRRKLRLLKEKRRQAAKARKKKQ